MEDITGKLTGKQARAVLCLLSAPNLEAAAKAAKVSVTTLWRWMQTPSFQKACRETRRQAVGRAVGEIQAASSEAVGVLRSIMAEKDAPASRLGAAKAILEFSLKTLETEFLEERLERLEAIVAQRPGPRRVG